MVVAHTKCRMASGDEDDIHAARRCRRPDTRSLAFLVTDDQRPRSEPSPARALVAVPLAVAGGWVSVRRGYAAQPAAGASKPPPPTTPSRNFLRIRRRSATMLARLHRAMVVAVVNQWPPDRANGPNARLCTLARRGYRGKRFRPRRPSRRLCVAASWKPWPGRRARSQRGRRAGAARACWAARSDRRGCRSPAARR